MPDAVDDVLRFEMLSRREIRYQIIHPHRPVFNLEESTLANIVGDRQLLVVIDRLVESLYGGQLRKYAQAHLNVAQIVLIDGGEANKSMRQVERICEAAMACGLDRNGIIVGVGGGVTLDVGGFTASIYRRGIACLRIPTTLIGQVDVSVGVKHGVNVGRFKNILGSFHPPLASIVDVSFLESLPLVHVSAGLAEILKMALICDSNLFDMLEAHGTALLASRFQQPRSSARLIMGRAEAAMLRELKDNLFETDLKRSVDFGHSFSPAIESASNYSVLHGHAVGLDMLISTYIAVERGICPHQVLHQMLCLYTRLALPVAQDICTAAHLHDSLSSIRAHRGGTLNLVVPAQIGSPAFLQDVHLTELQNAINFFSEARCQP